MNLKEKLEAITSTPTSKWKDNAQFLRANPWIRAYSSQIARRILAIIKKDKGLSQELLANSLNVSPQRISKIIKGKENLTLETIYNLSKALGQELIAFPEYEYSKPKSEKPVQYVQGSMNTKTQTKTLIKSDNAFLISGDFYLYIEKGKIKKPFEIGKNTLSTEMIDLAIE